MNRCAHLESYNVYLSAAAIGFACSASGRRLWDTSDGRRGGGGGKLVAGRATTRGRGATRAAALGAAALQAKRSQWRGIITGESSRNDASEALRGHFDQYRCASAEPSGRNRSHLLYNSRTRTHSRPARTPAWRAVDWSRGLVDQSQATKSRRSKRGAAPQSTAHLDGIGCPATGGTSLASLWPPFTCSFLSGVASRTMTKFVRALAVPKKCCSAAGRPQTAPWTLPRRGAPPRHPRGCRRGTPCRRVRPLC